MPKIAELTEEISQADQTFDQSIGELRDKQVFLFFFVIFFCCSMELNFHPLPRCETAMKSMSIEIQELDGAKRALESSMWKTRTEK